MTHSCRISFSAIPHSLSSDAEDAPLPPLDKSPAGSRVSLQLTPLGHFASKFSFSVILITIGRDASHPCQDPPHAARTAACHSGSASMTHSHHIPFSNIPRPFGSGAKNAPLPPLDKPPAGSRVSLRLTPLGHPASRFNFSAVHIPIGRDAAHPCPAPPLAARTAACHSDSASMTHSRRIPFPDIPRPFGSGAKDAPLPPPAKSPAGSRVFLRLTPPGHPASRFNSSAVHIPIGRDASHPCQDKRGLRYNYNFPQMKHCIHPASHHSPFRLCRLVKWLSRISSHPSATLRGVPVFHGPLDKPRSV